MTIDPAVELKLNELKKHSAYLSAESCRINAKLCKISLLLSDTSSRYRNLIREVRQSVVGDRWFKWVTKDGRPSCSVARTRGTVKKFALPIEGSIGEWYHHMGPLVLCKEGFHASRFPVRHQSFNATSLWEVEVSAERIDTPSKSVCRSIRFVREIKKGTKEYEIILNT